MMGGCMAYFRKLRDLFDPVPNTGTFSLLATEIVRWIAMVVPLILSIWRYYVLATVGQVEVDDPALFWGSVVGGILLISLLVYLPFKLLALRYRVKHNRLKDYRWRPTTIVYLILCALPSLSLILAATHMDKKEAETTTNAFTSVAVPDVTSETFVPGDGDTCTETIDAITATVMQMVVLGLTVTEWMSKAREEHITFDLITAMSMDFFFAYDCIAFLMMPTMSCDIYSSHWMYICFVFGYISMFRYVPLQPIGHNEKGAFIGAAVHILVNIFAVDVPYVVIRVWTMVEYGLVISELIYPLKNFGMICFGLAQLAIIYRDRRVVKMSASKWASVALLYTEKRRSKLPNTWDLVDGGKCVKECCARVSSGFSADQTEGTEERRQGHTNTAIELKGE